MTRATLAKLLAFVLVLVTACDRPLDNLVGRGSSAPIAMTIEQIADTGQPGQFILSGTATLPDETPLTVSAVRRINPQPNDRSLDGESRYAILDRTSAMVREGRWQAQLSLWEISPDGYYQENWQLTNSKGSEPELANLAVDFWATLEPLDLAQSKLKDRSEVFDSTLNPLLNFTPSGEPYLKVIEPKLVALPSARAVVPVSLPEQERTTWKERLMLENPDIRLTEQPPIPFQANDNLPLPAENLLR